MDNPEKLTNKHQRIPKGQSKTDNPEKLTNKHQRIPKGQSKMDNPEKLVTYGTYAEIVMDITTRNSEINRTTQKTYLRYQHI